MKKLLVIALLTFAALGCEDPSEPDGSAELRGAVDAPRTTERRERPPQPDPRAVLPPMPGPRTNTPGGAAAGLH